MRSVWDFKSYLDLTGEVVIVPGIEKSCVYYREWKKTVNPGTVLKDFYLLREGIIKGLYDYIILIYSPGHNTPISFYGFHGSKPQHLDRLIIFDLYLHLKSYSIWLYMKKCKCEVAEKFKKYIEQLGFKP